MSKIIVETTKVKEIKGNSKKDGRPYCLRSQKALYRGERLVGEIEMLLEDDQPPYAEGTYELDLERSLSIGSFGRLMFRPVLKADAATPKFAAVQR